MGLNTSIIKNDDYTIEGKKLIFLWNFNKSLVNYKWPKNINEIEFNLAYNQPFDNVTLPETVKHLKFNIIFNQELNFNILLESITLNLKGFYDKPLNLPDSLKSLTLNDKYDKPLNLPKNLLNLTLSMYYPYKNVLKLPENLECLTFIKNENKHPLYKINLYNIIFNENLKYINDYSCSIYYNENMPQLLEINHFKYILNTNDKYEKINVYKKPVNVKSALRH